MVKKKMIIGGGIVVVMILCIGIASKNKPDTETNIGGDKKGTRVTVEYVKEEDIETKISSSGKLEAVDTKTIYLDRTNKVVILHKEIGDEVQEGELLITLDKEAAIRTQNELEALEKQLEAEQKALSVLKGKSSKAEILSASATLAELKDSRENIQNNIQDAKIKLEDLNKSLMDAKEDLEVNQQLFEVGAIAQSDLEDLEDQISDIKQQIEQQKNSITLSENSLTTLDAKISTAQYNLDLLENKVSDATKEQQIVVKESSIKSIENQIYNSKKDLTKASTEIVAPISGIITYLPDEEGMNVSGGEKIVTIVDPTKMKVECDISPYYSPDLTLGLDAIIKYTGSKTIEMPGTVTKIAAIATVKETANSDTASLPVEITATEQNEIIKPGFSVDVKIITATRENVCVVPILAIAEEDDMSYIYVVKEDGSLEKREVIQGLSNGLDIEVSNVEPGEMIVSVVEDYLTDGMKVSYEKIGDES